VIERGVAPPGDSTVARHRAGASLLGKPWLFVVVVCSRGLPSKEAKRVRFGLIDVVLAVVLIILLVLVIRQLLY
jgi:hypothetical protein